MEKAKEKRTIIYILICVGLVCLIWGRYVLGVNRMNQRIDALWKDVFSWTVQVDEGRRGEGNVFLEGFAFELNKDARYKAYDIVLHNLKEKNCEIILRPEWESSYRFSTFLWDGILYRIAKPECEFTKGSVYFQLTTTELDRLPEHRLVDETYWDSYSFSFL